MKVLECTIGDKHRCIKTVQVLLNYRNGAKLVIDGDFGVKTYTAVMDFQRAKGLKVDGIVGENTWRELLEGEK